MEKHCIVLGGGGWMMGEIPSKLDSYVLSLSGKSNPKICYLSTATGDAEEVIQRFYDSKLSANLSHYPLFKLDRDWQTKLFEQDIIYVGGGNTRSMLALWREWGIDIILRECYERGIILCGMSAGAICWFEYGITDSDPNEYSVINGLGFVKGLAAAHFSCTDPKYGIFTAFAAKNPDVCCYGISDYAAIHFINGVSSNEIVSHKEAKVIVKNSL
ncbi:TPA: Type 1 glutamine amidotransferase-like domain-containing protein [Vibrio parahaemolyticus]|uniref:Type 1 glutamine amidotransferase-like domain-containing protein n=1 Tax=Vibrio parahaemolyticus TaxID=670 RepID=UPI0023627A85|nr:peptidase E [Vibrio parahaemolyticus]HCZ9682508.1 peptidase E [Vibrio parahaemolyticus]